MPLSVSSYKSRRLLKNWSRVPKTPTSFMNSFGTYGKAWKNVPDRPYSAFRYSRNPAISLRGRMYLSNDAKYKSQIFSLYSETFSLSQYAPNLRNKVANGELEETI